MTTPTKPKEPRAGKATRAGKPTKIRKVPSPDEVAPQTMMNPLPNAAGAGGPGEDDAGMGDTVMKKQELIQRVVERSGAKKKDAKPVVEAMLEVLGEALAEGRELNLHPMGKLKRNRTKETAKARVIICKIRQSLDAEKDAPTPDEGVAAAAE